MSDPTSKDLDRVAAAIHPLLPVPAARMPYASLDSSAKARLLQIARAAYYAMQDPPAG